MTHWLDNLAKECDAAADIGAESAQLLDSLTQHAAIFADGETIDVLELATALDAAKTQIELLQELLRTKEVEIADLRADNRELTEINKMLCDKIEKETK